MVRDQYSAPARCEALEKLVDTCLSSEEPGLRESKINMICMERRTCLCEDGGQTRLVNRD